MCVCSHLVQSQRLAMAQFGEQSLRTAMTRERMHFHRTWLEEEERRRREAEIERARLARAKRRAMVAAWKRFVEKMLE